MPNTPPRLEHVGRGEQRTFRRAATLRAGSGSDPRRGRTTRSSGSSKYSALATNVTRRGTTSGMKIESRNERWFAARITGPLSGTCSRPSMRTRTPAPMSGVALSFITQSAARANDYEARRILDHGVGRPASAQSPAMPRRRRARSILGSVPAARRRRYPPAAIASISARSRRARQPPGERCRRLAAS